MGGQSPDTRWVESQSLLPVLLSPPPCVCLTISLTVAETALVCPEGGNGDPTTISAMESTRVDRMEEMRVCQLGEYGLSGETEFEEHAG
jgi:hypothetical protein